MRTSLRLIAAAVSMLTIGADMSALTTDEPITISGKEYTLRTYVRRDIGPGTTYTRYSVIGFPLNVNVITMDLDNPYNTLETMQAKDRTNSTETLVSAAARYTSSEHKVIGGANGNFWCVSSQYPSSDFLVGTVFGADVRDGKVITNTVMVNDPWCDVYQTPIVGLDKDKKLWLKPMGWKGTIKSDKLDATEFTQVNRVVHDGQMCMYNSYFGRDKAFQPVEGYANGNTWHWRIIEGVSTEAYLDLCEGEHWKVGEDMRCVVRKVVPNAGTGKLGDYELAFVGRGACAEALNKLSEGDIVTVNQGWTTYDTNETPRLYNCIQGLSNIINDGVNDDAGNALEYNSKVYSRTGYGSSADGRTLCVMVIDKSTDFDWGPSAGCTTADMADIARHLGCVTMSVVDAGGSAQLFVQDRVVNTTTETIPRAIANGMFCVSTAPEDKTVTRIAFNDVDITVPTYATIIPRILAYNKYGDLVDENFFDAQLSCDAAIGTCEGNAFIAGSTPGVGTLTATYGDCTISKQIELVKADVALKLGNILIDDVREYLLEIVATADREQYNYDPGEFQWEVADRSIADIDVHGMLRGIKNGTTTITGTRGDLEITATVNVQIPESDAVSQDSWDNWKLSGFGVKNLNVTADGDVTFNVNSLRNSYVQFKKDYDIFSCPDSLTINFYTSAKFNSVTFCVRSAGSKNINIKIEPAEGDNYFQPTATEAKVTGADGVTRRCRMYVPAGSSEMQIVLPMSALGEPSYVGIYPINMQFVRFGLLSSAQDNLGTHTMRVGRLVAHYNRNNAVEDVAVDGSASPALTIWPNPVDAGGNINVGGVSGIVRADIYSLAGARIFSTGDAACINAPSVPGVYLLRVTGADGTAAVAKLVVR